MRLSFQKAFRSKRTQTAFLVFLSAFSTMVGIHPFLLKTLSIGMGYHLIPGMLGFRHGFRADTLSQAPHYVSDEVRMFAPGVPIHADFYGYIFPFELLAECTKKNPALSCACELNKAHRLPGYGIWYALVRVIFRSNGDKWYPYLLFFHIFWASLAAAALGDLIYGLTLSRRLAILSALLYVIFPFVLRYVYTPGSESMNYSFLTLFLWAFWRSERKHLGWLLLSGVLLTEAILIRPITIAVLPFAVGVLLLRGRLFIRPIIYLLAPFLVFQIYWQICNYINHKKFHILSPTMYVSNIEHTEWGSVGFLLGSFGDNYYWFYNPRYKFPKRAFTSQFGPQAEKEIAEYYRKYFAGEVSEDFPAGYSNVWRRSIRKEKPFLYHVGSRFYAVLNFFTSHLQESFYYTRPMRAGWAYIVVYGFSGLLWVFFVGIGLLGSVYYVLKWRRRWFLAFLSVSSAAAWGSYVFLLQIQSRYFLFPMTFFVILSIVFVWERLLGRSVRDD